MSVIEFPENKKSPENKQSLDKKIQAVLEGDYAAIRQQARDFLTQPDLLPPPPGISTKEYREKTLAWTKKMAEAGFAQLPFDPKYGGAGDAKKSMNFIEMIAHQDLSFMIKQGVNFGLFGLGIQNLGTAKHHEKYLNDIMNGKLLGGFAMTEVAGGSDVRNIKTEAVYDPATRSFTINTPVDSARKAFIGNAAQHGEMVIVFAQLKMGRDEQSKGVHAFLVPIRDKAAGKVLPGITIEDCGEKIGMNGVDNAYMSFDKVKIPCDAMLDRFASIDEQGQYQSDIPNKSARFFKMIGTLVTGRVALAAASLSAAKSTLAASVTYASTREVFGTKLLDKQATQTRLFPPLADAYAMHFATRQLFDKFASNSADIETLAAALKAKSSDDAIRTIDEARRVNGGAGYMDDTRYGRFRDDVDVFRTFEGDNTVLRLLVAKNRLTELGKQFNNASAAPKPSWPQDRTDAPHLLDPAFQADMVAARENDMLNGLMQRIAKGAAAVGGVDQAIEKSQNEMISYSDAYAEKIMLDQFIKAVAAQKDPETKAVLKDVCDVFAINTMLRHATWYLENGYMKPEKTKALAQLAETLNEKLRPHAVELVQAFAIPPELLSVPKPVSAATQNKKAANGKKPGV